MQNRGALILASVVAGCASQPSQQSLFHAPNDRALREKQCEIPAGNRTGDDGCYWDTSINLGPMPNQLYWHIDRFSDVEGAEAARTLQGRVTVVFGNQIILQTINDNPGWRPGNGEHLATVGPLLVSGGTDQTARLMEVSASIPNSISPHIHSGPEAIFQFAGSACVETPEGAHRIDVADSIVIPQNKPAQFQSGRDTASRSLILVIHPTDQPRMGDEPPWSPRLLCR